MAINWDKLPDNEGIDWGGLPDLDGLPDKAPQQSSGNFLTRSWAPPVNVPENLPWYQKLPGEVYNRYIEPMTNPLGAALTGITGVAAGPGLRMIAGMFPKAIGYGTGAASAYGATKAVPDAMSFAQNPSLSGALDVGEDLSMASLFPMFGRKFIGASTSPPKTLTSPFNVNDVPPAGPAIEQRMLPPIGGAGRLKPTFPTSQPGIGHELKPLPPELTGLTLGQPTVFRNPKTNRIEKLPPIDIDPDAVTFTGAKPNEMSMMDMASAFSRKPDIDVTPISVTPANAKAVAAEAANSQFPAVKQGLWSQIVNDSRNLKTIWDFSAPLRQGVFLINKWEVGQFNDMFKSAGSQKAYDAVIDSIKKGPNFEFKKDVMGIGYTGPLGKTEEAINHGWIERHILGALQSNRAYMAFTNKLRDDTADNVLGLAEKAGFDIKNNQPLARELGTFINAASGRGSLGKLEPISPILNNAFFSPRLIASRLKMMNPNNFLQIGKEYGINSAEAWFMRKEYFKSLLSTAALGNSFLGLSRLAGADIETDPASSDFMKAKFGNTRLDPWGGNQQYLTFAQRIFPGLGRYKSSTNPQNQYNLSEAGFGQQTRLDVAAGFFGNKLNTPYRAVWDYLSQTKGRPFSWSLEAENAALPMMVQSLGEALRENPELGMATLPFGTFGGGIQTYGGQDSNQPLLLP